MPNMHSKAGHIPIRTCVVCRQKSAQTGLLAFFLLPAGITYDLARRINTRHYYHCPACLAGLPKWRKKRAKR